MRYQQVQQDKYYFLITFLQLQKVSQGVSIFS